MSKIFKKTYKFAAFTSAYITLTLTLITALAFYFFLGTSYWIILVLAIICYLVSFFLIQYRVEQFIYNRIKKIYDDVSLLDTSNIGEQKITTNMETLTREVERFAQNKKLEIEALKIRENYRK
jgi:two-component system phosphate regulon sensor histidine kinase PhoR